MNAPLERRTPKLPGGFSLPPFGLHQWLALVIVAVALWAVGMLWLGMRAGGQWMESWRGDVKFHVYLDHPDDARMKALADALAALPGVAGVRIVPQTEMQEWLRQWMGGQAALNDEDAQALLAALPGTVEVTPESTADEFLHADIADAAARLGAHVNRGEARLVQVRKWLANLSRLLWFMTLIAALAMAVVISNTLRMMLLARADEVSLMRLLGAEEWFVRMPFILEGMLLGAGAGLAGWALLWPVVLGAADWLEALRLHLSLAPLLPPMAGGGALVGALGAWLATLQMPERGG